MCLACNPMCPACNHPCPSLQPYVPQVDFQLRTTWGWRQMERPLVGLPWLFLNLQPGHHIFPAVRQPRLGPGRASVS